MNAYLQSMRNSEGASRKFALPGSRVWPYGSLALHRPAERVITLSWLSDKLPDRFISETLAQRVQGETGRNVVLVSLEETRHPVNGFNDGQHYVTLNVDTSGS